jgi:hypothetical protein
MGRRPRQQVKGEDGQVRYKCSGVCAEWLLPENFYKTSNGYHHGKCKKCTSKRGKGVGVGIADNVGPRPFVPKDPYADLGVQTNV